MTNLSNSADTATTAGSDGGNASGVADMSNTQQPAGHRPPQGYANTVPYAESVLPTSTSSPYQYRASGDPSTTTQPPIYPYRVNPSLASNSNGILPGVHTLERTHQRPHQPPQPAPQIPPMAAMLPPVRSTVGSSFPYFAHPGMPFPTPFGIPPGMMPGLRPKKVSAFQPGHWAGALLCTDEFMCRRSRDGQRRGV